MFTTLGFGDDAAKSVCANLVRLCEAKYYHGCLFYNVQPNCLAQAGDPTGAGTGGESLWGARFDDEFDSRLLHSERGVLAYANDGLNRNRSQFYVTLKSASHLDNKHTVFGKVVGGHDTLTRIENVPVDDADDHRPREDVTILGATVFVDPTAEADAAFEAEVREAIAKRDAPAAAPAAAPPPL